jgi:Ran GTPase-activating protein 1
MASSSFSLAGEGLKLNTADELQSHVASLVESKDVAHIDLSGNTFGVPACEALAPILSSKSSTLRSIDLHDIFTSRLLEEIPPALSALLNALLECENLQKVDLSDNAFGLNTKDPLVDFLSKHTPLQHLILNNNGMGPIAGTLIANALTSLAARKAEARKEGKAVPDLESIVCGRNRLENGSMGAWAKAYEAHKSGMKSVKMTQNGIRQEGISHLLRSGLRHCKNLEVLDMQDNTFTVMGAGALSEVIPTWTTLKELGVGDDLLGATGSIKVFEALAKGENRATEVLRLQYNDITSKGVESLLQVAKDAMPSLRRIELNGNKFNEDDASIEALAVLLSERKSTAEKDDDPPDFWGLDELDELEEESSDEEEDESAEEEEEEEQEKEEDEIRERILEEAEEVENQPVAQRKDPDIDELADALKKTGI